MIVKSCLRVESRKLSRGKEVQRYAVQMASQMNKYMQARTKLAVEGLMLQNYDGKNIRWKTPTKPEHSKYRELHMLPKDVFQPIQANMVPECCDELWIDPEQHVVGSIGRSSRL